MHDPSAVVHTLATPTAPPPVCARLVSQCPATPQRPLATACPQSQRQLLLHPWIAGAGAGAGAGTGVAVPSSGDVGAAVGKGSIAEEPVAAPVAEETEEQVEGEEAETEGVAEAEEEAEDVAPVDYAAASDVEYEDEEDETWAHIEEVVSA